LNVWFAHYYPNDIGIVRERALKELHGIEHCHAEWRFTCKYLPDVALYSWMNNGLQTVKLLWVGKHHASERFPIHTPIRPEDAWTEGILNLCDQRSPRSHQFMHHLVGVDPLRGAQLKKKITHGCLAAGYGAREP